MIYWSLLATVNMQLKVIHLFNHYQKIERDMLELNTIKHSLPKARTYNHRMLLVLQEEMENLKKIQNKILLQIIKDPPTTLKEIPNEDNKQRTTPTSTNQGKDKQKDPISSWPTQPEITLPENKKGKNERSIPQEKTPTSKITQKVEANKHKIEKKSENMDRTPSEDFRFNFQ